jgi:hypothetical protein
MKYISNAYPHLLSLHALNGSPIVRLQRPIGLFCMLILFSTLPIRGDDLKATIDACGKPTDQYDIGDRKENMWLVYYKRKHINLVYEKVNGQWSWIFADDHESSAMLTNPDLLSKMPCMARLLAASGQRSDQAPPEQAIGQSVANVKESDGGAQIFIVAIGAVIIIFVALSNHKKRQAMLALANSPVRCPYCGSQQVHAEKRGWKWTTGLLGSRKIYITCLRCGNRFRPGQGA